MAGKARTAGTCSETIMKLQLLGLTAVCAILATLTMAPVRAQAPARKPDSNLLQLMRGIVYPASNVVFASQDDLTKLPKADDPSTSPNPLTSSYGGWTAVENAALALSESASLLTVPGRVCSNGKPVPVQRADWMKFTEGLRVAGLKAYQAAQSKNTDKMVDVTGDVAEACSNCHEVYREKKNAADRCTP
jgi:hypothetical protein